MRFMMVNGAMPDPNSVVMFKCMESLHKAGVLLAPTQEEEKS